MTREIQEKKEGEGGERKSLRESQLLCAMRVRQPVTFVLVLY